MAKHLPPFKAPPPKSQYVAAKGGIEFNGKKYAVGQVVDVTGVPVRRLRQLLTWRRLRFTGSPADSPASRIVGESIRDKRAAKQLAAEAVVAPTAETPPDEA